MKTIISLSGKAKRVPLSKNCFMYLAESEYSVSFDDSSFYDTLESVIDIYRGVPNKIQITRGLLAKTPQELLSALNAMLGNMPRTFSSMEKMKFTKSFMKDVGDMTGVLQAGINKLQAYISKQE